MGNKVHFRKVSFGWRKFTVHDRDLSRWALQKAREIDPDSFKTSDKWMKDFKKEWNWIQQL